MKLTNKVKGIMLRLNEDHEPLILNDEDNECTHYKCGCNIAENDNGQVSYYVCKEHVETEKLMKHFSAEDYENFWGKPLVQAAIITTLLLLIFFSKTHLNP